MVSIFPRSKNSVLYLYNQSRVKNVIPSLDKTIQSAYLLKKSYAYLMKNQIQIHQNIHFNIGWWIYEFAIVKIPYTIPKKTIVHTVSLKTTCPL